MNDDHTRRDADDQPEFAIHIGARLVCATPERVEFEMPVTQALANRIAKEGLDVTIEVDGGIVPETARQALDAGATALVAGTAAFRGGPDHYAANIRALRGEG